MYDETNEAYLKYSGRSSVLALTSNWRNVALFFKYKLKGYNVERLWILIFHIPSEIEVDHTQSLDM